jgi:hypothetical protein
VIRQVIGWALIVAAVGIVVYAVATYLIMHLVLNPNAPEGPRTWPTPTYTDVPLIPPPGDPGPV